jgi:hypothetical protein
MHKRMTITLDEAVYDGLYRTVGKRRMSQFIEDLLRQHVVDTALDNGYQAMAADKSRLKSQLGALSKAGMLFVEDAINVHLALP